MGSMAFSCHSEMWCTCLSLLMSLILLLLSRRSMISRYSFYYYKYSFLPLSLFSLFFYIFFPPLFFLFLPLLFSLLCNFFLLFFLLSSSFLPSFVDLVCRARGWEGVRENETQLHQFYWTWISNKIRGILKWRQIYVYLF